MKICKLFILSAVLLLCNPFTAIAGVIHFDDLSNGTIVTNQYAGLGATFTPTHFSVIGGLAEGDPGNWDLHGTNGSHFLGFNGSPGYTQVITWAADILGFSLDVSRSNGSNNGDTFTATGLLNGVIQDSVTITLAAINTWSTISLNGVFDEIQWSGGGAGFHPYGVDNIVFSEAQVPEPAMIALLSLGLLGLRFKRRYLI